MPVHLVTNNMGEAVAIQIPIEEWRKIKSKYPDIDVTEDDLPFWQKEMLNDRIAAIEKNPERLNSLEELFAELDKDDDDL